MTDNTVRPPDHDGTTVLIGYHGTLRGAVPFSPSCLTAGTARDLFGAACEQLEELWGNPETWNPKAVRWEMVPESTEDER